MTEQIIQLYNSWSKDLFCSISPVAVHGSNRSYYRIQGTQSSCLAAVNEDIKENEAFIYLSHFFRSHRLTVPEVYWVSPEKNIYFIEDLGNTTLFDYLLSKPIASRYDNDTLCLYKEILRQLIKFQLAGKENLDYSNCYPRAAFDNQSIQWDLNYFKYYFLKLSGISFNEQLLENEFHTFISLLSEAEGDYFLYRDFQSRNIMLTEKGIYFIDFQGGRKGPLAYDPASLLYNAKAELPPKLREELLQFYISELSTQQDIDIKTFQTQFYLCVLVRIMQAMGAYGYRGFFERKAHFLKSITPALHNIQWLLQKNLIPQELPYLSHILRLLVDNKRLRALIPDDIPAEGLVISLCSFSFKKGYPIDGSGNGGGFIMDCRALPNPGRYPEYKNLTGKDREVIDFLEKEESVTLFLQNAYHLIEQSVKNYLERGFTHLSIGFGCTGGQHRSVYCTEKIAAKLKEIHTCKVQILHREQMG